MYKSWAFLDVAGITLIVEGGNLTGFDLACTHPYSSSPCCETDEIGGTAAQISDLRPRFDRARKND